VLDNDKPTIHSPLSPLPPGAGAVIHSHAKAAVMATLLYPGEEFYISHQQMIKGISIGQTGKRLK